MATSLDGVNSILSNWSCIENNLDPINYEKDKVISTSDIDGSLRDAVEVISQYCSIGLIEAWFIDKLEKRLQQCVVPQFWAYFSPDQHKEKSSLERVKLATCTLYDIFVKWDVPVRFIDQVHNKSLSSKDQCRTGFYDSVQLLYKGTLLSQISMHFENVMVQFYTTAFKAFLCKEITKDEDEVEALICPGCNMEADSCECKTILNTFHEVNKKLSELDLLERLAGEALTSVIHQHVEQHIQNSCKGNFESLYLASLETWLDTVVVGWLKTIFYSQNCLTDEPDQCSQSVIEKFRGRLMHFLYETYATTRMDEMFNIIIEFPESQPAIEDLKECLEKTNLRSKLVQSLKTALETRLLHPGVNTNDILIAYTSTIKTLWVLDLTGVLLELVCDPVHKYLRTRQDTVRCIVSSLTDDTSGELADELNKAEPLVLDDSYQSDDDAENWESWKPDPVDANPDKTSKSRRTSDIISMLVNIYGSKDMFVKEYRSLLADRILTQFNYDIQREIRHLELLKLRFGESNLHLCEVMLKDIADSKRINQHIHSDDMDVYKNQVKEFPVHSMILSAQFWPSLREERLELPSKIQAALDTYTKAFETLKGNRTLSWKSHLGLATVEIELKDRTLTLQVSPIHATILIHFEEKAQWTLEELSNIMKVPSSSLKRKMAFWQSHGIIKESGVDTYILLEEQKGKEKDVVVVDDEETESAMASSHEQREEELQVFWSYIVGMLTNLESLPLDRIHAMLKMFAIQSPTAIECSVQELRHFLDRKVKEQKLLLSSGLYRLPKTNS